MGMWRKIEAWWAALSGRQKAALGFVGGAVGAWAIEQLADAIKAAIPWWPIATVLDFLRDYIVTVPVATFALGGLIIGFWPSIRTAATRLAGLLQLIGMLAVGIASLWVIPNVMGWWFARTDPTTFTPQATFTVDTNKKKRTFLAQTPYEIAGLYRASTSIVADHQIYPLLGKWMAVTAKVEDVVDPDDSPDIIVGKRGTKVAVELRFQPPHQNEAARLHIGQRIYAVCLLASSPSTIVYLGHCELVRADP